MTIEKKKLGFGGQWIDLFKTGRHVGFDDDGKKVSVDIKPDFLKAVVDNYDATLHEAPACIGHPENDAPAFGWVAGMRVDGETLQAQFADTDPGFEQIVNEGRYKKRSPKFYLDEKGCGKFPYLRHVAWLGAEPPAVKGMRDVQRHAQFSEKKGETVAFEIEFSEGENMTDAEKKALQEETRTGVIEYLKEKLGFGKDEKPAAAAFSEADRAKLITDATAAASAAFSEELKKRDDKIAELTTQVQTQVGSSTRGELASFCDAMPGTVLPWMKKIGLVQFMEGLDDTAVTKKVSVLSFAEENGREVEKPIDVPQRQWFKNFLTTLNKIPQVRFGESFGDIKLKGDGSEAVEPERMNKMRSAAGIKTETAKS